MGKAVANKVVQNPELLKIFSIIDEKTQIFKHFEIFNDTI